MPFQKGNPGRPVGSKNKLTLEKEARRALFDEKVSQNWDKIVDKLMAKEEKYVADQFIGKARETVDHRVSFLFDDAEDQVE